ncbi:fatty acid desaturase [Actibacterium sp. 188UL27-1]|uniref:fatty acid desaturase n=1 Tax=Actibacterium sp. 188UL27-1 TaxID=2786961 RepID=UPI00195C68A2|nr:fatty acid desaturase [Actibacterium sp. 188UL27-1]MBM7066404.1 fatty acid desaturase [Actibacterium sp. 188UL27-1]
MDHWDLIAGMSAQDRAALTRRRNAPGLWHLAGHLTLIAATGTWIAAGWPFWGAVLPVHGIFLVFLFTLTHETTHKTPFATPWLNEWVGRACGFVLLIPFEWFRYFHLAHHRHTNIPGKDPELEGGGLPGTRRAYWWRVSGLPYWFRVIRQIAALVRGQGMADYIPNAARPLIVREARTMLAIYALAVGSLAISPALFWLWILPVVLGQPALRLYLMAEHGRCAFVADILDNTRTTFTNRIVRFLAWNMPYHTEHHTLPNVPFHALPRLHRIMAPHLKHTAPGYRWFNWRLLRDLPPAP